MKPIYPYRTLFGDLELAVGGVDIDGKWPGKDLADSQFRLVGLYALERADWASVTLDLRVTAPADEVGELDEEGREPRVTAVAFSRQTNGRQAVVLERSELDRSRWTGKLELERAHFREKVTVDAVMTATIDGVPYRWLAASDPWQVHFDEPAVPPIEGTLRVAWVHFKGELKEPTIPDEAADEAFYVALEEKPPIVYLSKDFPGLDGLLSDDPTRPREERALRDAEFRRIAAAAWTEIFNVSVAAIGQPEEEGAEPEWPREDWQEQALRNLLPTIYPTQSPIEALTQAYIDSRGDGALRLQALSQVAVTREIGAARSLRRSLDAMNTLGGQR